MVDVPRISGAGGPSEPAGGKGVPRTDAEKFKELMKVGDADADQKKKKKQQQEALEEKKAASRPESVPASQEREKSGELHKFKKAQKVEKPGEAEKRQKQQQKRPEEAAPAAERKRVDRPAAPRRAVETAPARVSESKHAAVSGHEKARPPAHPLHHAQQPSDLPAPPPPRAPEHVPFLEKEERIEKKAARPATPAPQKEEQKTAPSQIPEGAAFQQGTSLGPFFIPPAAETAPGYTQMKPEIFALFEKMVSTIMVMHDSGVTETVIHLSPADFSLFAGAQIVVREFSTAPKAFNIEFQGNAQNTVLFDQNMGDLMAAFQYGNYNFKINRMESSLLAADRPLFHRKEAAGDKEEKEGKKE